MKNSLFLAALCMGATQKDSLSGIIPRKHTHAKKLTVCLLPECEIMTTHNGGYCCAEHCKEHRVRRKANAKAQGRR